MKKLGEPKLQILQKEFDANKRILVTSDIHGNYNYFIKVLEKAHFSEDDILIIVGDIIEKGPESLKLLRYIMTLPNAITLIGNVDAWRLFMMDHIRAENCHEFYDYLLHMRKWRGTSLFDEMTQELGFLCQSAEEVWQVKERVFIAFAKELQFLVTLPTAIETAQYIFVHEGLPDTDLTKMKDYVLNDYFKLNGFFEKEMYFDKYIVVGHYPVSLYHRDIQSYTPLVNLEKKIISIDGGCGLKEDGQLNLMILPNIHASIEEITFIAHDDFPVYVAKTAQTVSEHSIHIHYLDPYIKIIRQQDEFSYVEHQSTGCKLWVLTDYLYENDTKCDDFTNYRLPVQVGDEVSLIRNTSKGALVKKEGVIGWYDGTLLELHM